MTIHADLELLAALAEGLLVVEGGRVTGANPAVERMTGLSHAQLVGSALAGLLCDPEGDPLRSFVASDAVRLRDAAGELVPVSLRPVNEGILLVVDRSRERRLEQEVWRLATGGAKEGSIGPLAGEAAALIEHEIGTATTVVRGCLRMLSEERIGTVTREQRTLLLDARREVDRVSALMANLISLASGEGHVALPIVRKPIRLRSLVESVVDTVRPLLEPRRLTLETDFDCQRDALSIDGGRIEQVLFNLLSNAIKFAPESSTIQVALHEIEDQEGTGLLALSVLDEGPGIGADEAERIFRAFERGDHAKTSGAPGMGLGLAVCDRVARAHGGRVEALPDGRGHVRLILPIDEVWEP